MLPSSALWGTTVFSIIGTYNILVAKTWYINFGYQFWFLGPKIIIFTKLMLHNIILKIIKFFIIYIGGSMGIFIVYIGIIGPSSHFNYTNFKVSLVIKEINLSGIFKMTHLAMLVNFHVNVVTCQNFNLPHLE
jgi:hypothetical protein